MVTKSNNITNKKQTQDTHTTIADHSTTIRTLVLICIIACLTKREKLGKRSNDEGFTGVSLSSFK